MAQEAPDAPEWTWVADGETAGRILIEPAGDERLVATHYGEQFASIELLDGEGRLVWSRTLGGEAQLFVVGMSVSVGDDGTTYVGGSFRGMVAFGDDDDTLSTQACSFPGGLAPCYEGFVAAYDQAGKFRWVRRTGHIFHMAAARGGVVVAGSYGGRRPYAPEEMAPAPPMGGNFFVAQLDAAGNEVWRYRNPTIHTAFIYDMVIDARGATLLSIQYSVRDDPRAFFPALMQLSADGQEVWRRDLDGGLLALTENGDIIVTWPVAMDVEQAPYTLYVHRYDGATGELRWRRGLGDWRVGGGWVYLSDVAIDPAGDVVILGSMYGRLTVGASTVEATGTHDLFVARLRGEDGRPRDAATSGIAGSDIGGSPGWLPYGGTLLVLGRDDMIVAGAFEGELRVDGEIHVPPPGMLGIFIRRGDPFAVPPRLAPGAADQAPD